MMRIDKSIFSAEELSQYEALIAKAKVDPEAEEGEEEEVVPEVPEKEKQVEVEKEVEKSASPELAAALERLETLEKSYKMKEFSEIAKKYAPLGENVEELAKSLYNMKQSNEENYNAYISILDKSLGIVEKSGLFQEVGKSASGAGGSVIDKVEAAASEIMKSDESMTREQAIAKAWETNPEFIAEYEAEYKA